MATTTRRKTNSTSARTRSRRAGASRSGAGKSASKTSSAASRSKGMSTTAKVAIATTAGAVAATAAGFATSDKGREIRKKVSKKIQELVDDGYITLKNSRVRHVVEEIESVLGGLLHMGKQGMAKHGRSEKK